MIKKLIFISALLFIVGCEREATFVCTTASGIDYKEVILSKDRSHIKVTAVNVGEDFSTVMWKQVERPNLYEIQFNQRYPPLEVGVYTYNTLNKTLNIRFHTSPGYDCPRK